MSESDLFLYELRDDHIAVMTLNRPDKMNALSDDLAKAILEGLERFEADQNAWVGVLTGNGKAFCAGGDLENMRVSSMDEGDWVEAVTHLMPMFDALEQHKKPIIGAINGFAMGGGLEAAMACDIRIAEEHAQMALPEAKVGLLPCAGGTQRLAELVGTGWAKRVILCGERLKADKALEVGLVEEVVPSGTALEAAMALAEKVGEQSPISVTACKKLIHSARDIAIAGGLEDERTEFVELFSTEDQREGVNAFLEKRQPEWKNC